MKSRYDMPNNEGYYTIMQRYANLSGQSGVRQYETGPDYILVQFNDSDIYEYTYSSAGKVNIEEMKRLAGEGKGLSTFISQKVKKKYSRKIR